MSKEKQGNWFVRHKVLTVVIAVVALIAIISAASGDSDTATVVDTSTKDTSTSTDTTQEKTEFAVGEAISFDGKEVTVANVERNWNSGNQYITPDSGNEYVKVQVAIKNNSSSQVSYNTFDWKLQDSNGVIKDVDSTAFMVDGGLNSGELAAGGNVSGFLVFQVPEGDTGLQLQYSPSFWTSKKLTINL